MTTFDKRQNVERVTGVDLSQTGEVVVIQVIGDVHVSLDIEGTADAEYAVDVSPDATNWTEGLYAYGPGTSIRDDFSVPDKYLRVRVTTAAADGDTADVTLQGAK